MNKGIIVSRNNFYLSSFFEWNVRIINITVNESSYITIQYLGKFIRIKLFERRLMILPTIQMLGVITRGLANQFGNHLSLEK